MKFRRTIGYRGFPLKWKLLKVPVKQMKQDSCGILRNYLIKTLESGRHLSAEPLFMENNG